MSSSERVMTDTDDAVSPAGFATWVRALRPQQWLKNLFVLAPVLFGGKLLVREADVAGLMAFAAFCAAASGAYLMNDVADRERDRLHPMKRLRPIAAGEITPRQAMVAALVLVSTGLVLAFACNRLTGVLLLAYLVLNLAYSTKLKGVVILDVFSLAGFFVLRLLAGAAAVQVEASLWLLLCGGLLALFLGFAKRRHELVLLGAQGAEHRGVLAKYTTGFLDQLSTVLLAVTLVTYIMFTLDSKTARLAGSQLLSYSTVFVLYGVLRYLYLVHRDRGGNPTDVLINDRPLLGACVLWGGYCAAVLYWGRYSA